MTNDETALALLNSRVTEHGSRLSLCEKEIGVSSFQLTKIEEALEKIDRRLEKFLHLSPCNYIERIDNRLKIIEDIEAGRNEIKRGVSGKVVAIITTAVATAICGGFWIYIKEAMQK